MFFYLSHFCVWFCFKLTLADSEVVCGAEQIRIIDPVTGSVVGCEECRWCPAGKGASVTCGGSLAVNTGVQCLPCMSGVTYSTGYSPNACDNCGKCGTHRTITRNCTVFSDVQCAAKCDKGFYPDGMTGMCQPCSYCCFDIDDRVMKKCSTDGMKTNQQCGVERSDYCRKVVARKSSHITVSSSPSPSPAPNHKKTSNKSIGK